MGLSTEMNTKERFIVIMSRKGLLHLDLKSVWKYRELLYFLVWRDVMVRYKQTAIGIAWAILQPLITMGIFTVIFGRLAKISSDGIPYPVFAFTALLPWSYFSQALTRNSNSVVSNSNLVTKVYFPRLLIPIAASLAPIVDLCFSFVILLVLMAWYKITPTLCLLSLPLFLALCVMTALAVGFWSSALNVRYRDVGHVIPFLIQIWMYASPIVYPASMIPEQWRLLYSLNPMVGVIEGFRWALLGKQSPDFAMMSVSFAVVSVLFVGGIVYFKKLEQEFADVI